MSHGSRRRKLLLLLASAAAALLLLGAFLLHFLSRPARLAAMASESLGMEVDIGDSALAFRPGLHLVLEDLRVRNRGLDLVAAERADFGIDLLPLLLLEVRLDEVALEGYRISIERESDRRFNYERDKPRERRRPFDLKKAALRDGSVAYLDGATGKAVEARGCDVDATELSHPGGALTDAFPREVAIAMRFVCAELQREDLLLTEVEGTLRGKDGVFDFEPVTMRLLGGQGTATLEVDRREDVPRVLVRGSAPDVELAELLATTSSAAVARGRVALALDLAMEGSIWEELIGSAAGSASLGGENLTLEGLDLDRALSRYRKTQSFNLIDVGGLFLAGPLGVGLTKGYDFASLFRGSEGSTPIRRLISEWKVERGVAHAQDVAMTTAENRIALRGGLDFAREEFQDVTVAVVGPSGCPIVQQRILGPFAEPVVEKPSFFKSLAGPVIGLFRRARNVFPHDDCEPFYEGSLEAPDPPEKREKKKD